jgi:hypothetical protein
MRPNLNVSWENLKRPLTDLADIVTPVDTTDGAGGTLAPNYQLSLRTTGPFRGMVRRLFDRWDKVGREVVDARDWDGWRSDSDSSSIFQEMLDECPSGGRLVFPIKTIGLENQVNITKNCYIEGEGGVGDSGGTIFQALTAGLNMLVINGGPGVRVTSARFDMHVPGGGLDESADSAIYLQASGVEGDYRFQDCFFNNPGTRATVKQIRIGVNDNQNNENVLIWKCQFDVSGTLDNQNLNRGAGLYVEDNSNALGIRMRDCWIRAATVGARFYAGSDVIDGLFTTFNTYDFETSGYMTVKNYRSEVGRHMARCGGNRVTFEQCQFECSDTTGFPSQTDQSTRIAVPVIELKANDATLAFRNCNFTCVSGRGAEVMMFRNTDGTYPQCRIYLDQTDLPNNDVERLGFNERMVLKHKTWANGVLWEIISNGSFLSDQGQQANTGPSIMSLMPDFLPFTANSSTDIIDTGTFTPVIGMALTVSNSGGALPAPLVANTTYYARDVSGHTCKLASTPGGAAINLTTNGSGTNLFYANYARVNLLGYDAYRNTLNIGHGLIGAIKFWLRLPRILQLQAGMTNFAADDGTVLGFDTAGNEWLKFVLNRTGGVPDIGLIVKRNSGDGTVEFYNLQNSPYNDWKFFGGYLRANNLIHSTSGGFKFPDNTIQTTAASGGATIAHTGNLIKGDGSGNGIDSGLAAADIATHSDLAAVASPFVLLADNVTIDLASPSPQTLYAVPSGKNDFPLFYLFRNGDGSDGGGTIFSIGYNSPNYDNVQGNLDTGITAPGQFTFFTSGMNSSTGVGAGSVVMGTPGDVLKLLIPSPAVVDSAAKIDVFGVRRDA